MHLTWWMLIFASAAASGLLDVLTSRLPSGLCFAEARLGATVVFGIAFPIWLLGLSLRSPLIRFFSTCRAQIYTWVGQGGPCETAFAYNYQSGCSPLQHIQQPTGYKIYTRCCRQSQDRQKTDAPARLA